MRSNERHGADQREGARAVTAKRRLPATVLALGVTSFFTDVGSEMIFPLLPAFVVALGAGPAFLGLVEGLADAVSSLLKLASGYVADHTPRKKPLVLAGYGVAAVVRPLMSLAAAPWHVLAVRVVDRVGKGVRSTPRDALLAASVPRELAGRAFGFHRAMDHAGAVVGPLVATALLASGIELRDVFALAFVPGLLSVVAVAMVRERSAVEPARVGGVVAVAGGPSSSGASSGATSSAAASSDSPRLPSALRRYLVILFVFSLANSSDAFLLLRAKELGVSTAALPLLWTVFHVAKLLSSYVGGHWADRLARAKLIVAGWLVYAATYVAFAFATQAWQAWALMLVYGCYFGLTEPAEKALVKDLAPAALLGRAYGYYNFILGIAAVPAGLLTGWLWQSFGPSVALATGAVVACGAGVALMMQQRTAGSTLLR